MHAERAVFLRRAPSVQSEPWIEREHLYRERAVDHEKAPDVSERAVTRERAPESQERAEMSQPDTPRAPYYKSGKPKTCSLCGEPCQSWERNTDGTYTHAACLRPHLIYPLTRSV